MKNKEGCDTKVRILALERILQGTDKPLSTEEIMEILENTANQSDIVVP